MENLTINVSKQFDGFTFSITPLTRKSIEKAFPDANPIKSIFVAYDTHADFNTLRGSIEKYIYPALTGIPEKNLSDVDIKFVDPLTNQELYSIPSHVA